VPQKLGADIPPGNHKGKLQELLVRYELPPAKYTTMVVEGEGTHTPKFLVTVKIGGASEYYQYTGAVRTTKVDAEHAAAFRAVSDVSRWSADVAKG